METALEVGRRWVRVLAEAERRGFRVIRLRIPLSDYVTMSRFDIGAVACEQPNRFYGVPFEIRDAS